jgi:ketosteroid isomerase-like protein
MHQLILLISIIVLLFYQCSSPPASSETLIAEIEHTEQAFMQMAAESGIGQAFIEFAADDAILIRNAKAVEGKTAMKEYFLQNPDDGQTLVWAPRKIEVAQSGELAYSFGDFTFTQTDSAGSEQTFEGNFCTIWKRQPDGSWKFVMD